MPQSHQAHNAPLRARAAHSFSSDHSAQRERSLAPNGLVANAQKTTAPLTQIVRRAQIDPSRIPGSDVLYLQRTLGNQRVAQLLNRSASPARPPAIQTSAAAGSYPAGSGESASGDLESRLRRGGGSAMPESIRRTLEPKLGADLGSVKVHTGSDAVQLSRELGAKAFTHQNHIYYGAGQSPSDLPLTAHEAVHTIQQGAVQQAASRPGAMAQVQRKSFSPLDAHNHIQRFPWGKNKAKVSIPAPEEQSPKPDVSTFNYDTVDKVPHIADNMVEQGDTFRLTLGVEEAEKNFISNSIKFHMNKMLGRFGKKDMDKPFGTGHAWVELQIFGNRKRLAFDSYGFSGGGLEHPDHNAGDRGSEYLFRDYTVSKVAFQKVINRVKTLQASGLKYKTKGLNCTSFARDLLKTAGISFPGSRILPGMLIGAGSAFTPARLHQSLAKREKKGTAYKRLKGPKTIDEVLGSPHPQELVEAMSSQEGSSGGGLTTTSTSKLSIPAISPQAEGVLMQNLHRDNPLQTLIDQELASKDGLEGMTNEQVEQLAEHIGTDSVTIDGWIMLLLDA